MMLFCIIVSDVPVKKISAEHLLEPDNLAVATYILLLPLRSAKAQES